MPFAPGTAGSIVGLLCYMVLHRMSFPVYLLSVLTITVLAVWSSAIAERIYSEKDAKKIVVDEIAGMLVALAWMPFSMQAMIIGFILFRFFDITKLFPVNLAHRRLSGGMAVVMDDILAGIYTNICMHILRLLM